MAEKRAEYARLLDEATIKVADAADPLASGGVADAFAKDQELKREIGMDLERLYPDGCDECVHRWAPPRRMGAR